ncbi:MAG: SUMF1/EgtB/PvdO family nonheme iron enzyme [Bacteroidota bacterium]
MRILLLITAILTLSLTPASKQPDVRQGKDYALFFACNSYQNLENLKNPIQNARDIGSILERDYGFQKEIIPNPGLSKIRSVLARYQQDFATGRKNPNGQLLIFFTGHGKVEYENGFFIPSDGNPEDLYTTGFNYAYWRNFINNLNCQHILVAVDACFSVRFDPKWRGSKNPDFTRPGELSAQDKMLVQHRTKKARILFTSDGNEKETPDRSNFAKRFQEGLLSKGNGDNILTSTELYTFVETASPTPHCSDFGDDEVGSSFLFFRQEEDISGLETDLQAWETAQSLNILSAYQYYKSQHPRGDFIDLADKKIADLKRQADISAWGRTKRINTPAAYRTYLSQHPSGIYAEVAQTKINTPLPQMIYIQGGSFQMGSEKGASDEKPVHKVTLSNFYMAETEVTNAQYMAFVNATNSHHPEWMEKGNKYNVKTGTNSHYKKLGKALSADAHPVVGVSWNDAIAYCQWLSKETGQRFRLPTEAEWEYAAGGGTSDGTTYAGTSSGNIDAYAVYEGNSSNRTNSVKSKLPNSLGLYDMSGNVWEWCSDWFRDYPSTPQINPQGSSSGSSRVLRGGSWYDTARSCRVAARGSDLPSSRYGNGGFRLARSL